MTRSLALVAGVVTIAVLVVASAAQADPSTPGTAFSLKAPGAPFVASAGSFSCELPTATLHCNSPQDIRSAYGVDAVGDPSTGTGLLGQGQTIVLVDSYGSPTAANDLQVFHDQFFPNLPNPDFTQVFPNGKTDFGNSNGNGQSARSLQPAGRVRRPSTSNGRTRLHRSRRSS